MMNNTNFYISEWKPISELNPVQKDISEYGYDSSFVKKNGLDTKKSPLSSCSITGRINYYEPLEVKMKGEDILFRENDDLEYRKIPDQFFTQHGVFDNNNNGEFASWLEGTDNFFIEGNYCDMFDCGDFSYAISNQMHMGLRYFKIVKIDANLQYEVLYDTYQFDNWTSLEYMGHFENNKSIILVASGFIRINQGKESELKDKTLVFQIGEDGNFDIINEWNIILSYANSMVKKDNFLYLGQNKMVTRLNLDSGEVSFYTNKNPDELNALASIF